MTYLAITNPTPYKHETWYEYKFIRDDGMTCLIISNNPQPTLTDGYWHSIDAAGKEYAYRADTVREVQVRCIASAEYVQYGRILEWSRVHPLGAFE